jgi:hypothetical protein
MACPFFMAGRLALPRAEAGPEACEIIRKHTQITPQDHDDHHPVRRPRRIDRRLAAVHLVSHTSCKASAQAACASVRDSVQMVY